MRNLTTYTSGTKWLGFFYLLTMLWAAPAQAATQEAAVKAGFIYNFTKFIEWPIDVHRPGEFHLCVVGKDALQGALDVLDGKSVGKMHVTLKRNLSLDDIKECQMVYIAESEHQYLQGLLPLFAEHHVLTVSDTPEFIEQGGMIGLVRNGKRVGFEVNLDTVKAAGLRASAQLLKLAKQVKGNQ